MQQAATAYKGGRWADAEALCRRVLVARPDYFDALTLLGIMAAQTRRAEEAADFLGRAVAARPGSAAAHSNYGNALQALRRFEAALDSYGQALKIKPDNAEAYNNRGTALKELKRFEEALDSYGQALKIKPNYTEAYYNRGNALQELKRFEEALDSYGQALKIKPDYAEVYNNRGSALQQLKRLEDALDSYARALQLKPDFAEAYNNRGTTLQELKRFEEALDSYRQALKIKPDYAEAHNNRGTALKELKRFEEALDSYGQALKIMPNYTEAYYNRGNALQELKRFEEALDSYGQALKIKPDYAEVYNNRGSALQQLKRLEDALDSYARALQLKPDFAEAYNNRGTTLKELKRFEEALDSYAHALQSNPDGGWLFGMWLHVKMYLCDWSNLEALIPDLIAKIQQAKKVTTPFAVLGLIDDLALQRQATETWISEMYPASRSLPPLSTRCRRERIRIGYYSADYRAHATTHLMAGLFERHDRRRFELLAFSYGPDERDEMRERLAGAFDQFLDVRTKSDLEIARTSRELGIDIAVDLKGFTQDARIGIFSCRAAPIQVSYLGYPGTIGAPYIDYLIADQTLIPQESRPHYSEKIVYLPHSYQVNDRQRPIVETTFARAELGLPSTGFVFCCFNNNYKIGPDTFDGWMRILREVEGSVLWLLEDNSTAAANLRREAQARDVDAE